MQNILLNFNFANASNPEFVGVVGAAIGDIKNQNNEKLLNGSKIYYDTSVGYKPTENMFIKFSMNNYPRYYRNPYSRFLMTR